MKSKSQITEITLADVARKAKVCVSTASRVLNDIPTRIRISDKSRQKVHKAVQELGYIPSHAARTLKRGKTQAIGILGNHPESFMVANDFTSIIMRSLLLSAAKYHYNLTFLTAHTEPMKPWDLLKAVGTVDAVLVVNKDLNQDPELVARLKNLRKPVVYAIGYPDDAEEYAVSAHEVAGGKMAAQSLIKKGHRRIAIIRGEHYKNIFDLREQGIRMALKKHGIKLSHEDVIVWNQISREMIQKQKWTAAICLNDTAANSMNTQLKKAGLDVSNRLDIVVFSYQFGQRRLYPGHPFPSIQQPLDQIVSKGMEMAIQLIEGKKVSPRLQLFAYSADLTTNPSSRKVQNR